MTDNSVRAADRRGLVEPLTLSLVVGAMAAVMLAAHRAGHWWGDDWALYIRQADALVSGEPRRVLDENEFTVSMSRGAAFSPPLYPWGFPLVLAPFVAVWGTDIDRLTVVTVLSACAFACGWYLLARRRTGAVPAMVGVVAVTMTPLLLGWTELVQSEWTFMAVAMWALVALDRAVADQRLLGPAARWATLATLGLWAAAAFSVRREGLALIAAIGAAQLAAIVVVWRRDGRPRPDRRLLGQLLVPHATAAATVWLFQVLLPTTVIPRYSGTSPWKMWEHRQHHIDHVLEVVGLKRPWEDDPTVLGNAALGWVAAGLFFVLSLAGLAWALSRWRDIHLAVYALAAFAIGGSFRVAINRYVATVGPILVLLTLTLVVAIGGRAGRRRVGLAVAALAMTAIAVGNLANAHLRLDRAAELADRGAVEWGPTHPAALEMFAEVRALTEPGDVVGAPKARAMTFATERLAVQVDDYRPVPNIDLALVVTEPGTEIHDQLLGDPTYTRVWSNTRFTLFVPDRL